MSEAREGSLRIGFIAAADVSDPLAVSGMPHRMYRLLSERHQVRILSQEQVVEGREEAAARPAANGSARRGGRLTRYVPASVRAWGRVQKRAWEERRAGTPTRILGGARELAARVQARLRDEEHDVLFVCFGSGALVRLKTNVPIVTYSDATPRVLSETYSRFSRLGRPYAAACDRLERLALSKVRVAAYASKAALESAVNDYGLPRERAALVPMGANIMPPPEVLASHRPEAPSREDVRLLIIAKDPKRKRVDVAVRATELLSSWGFKARLWYIGPYFRPAARSRVVENVGFLRLGDPKARAHQVELLAKSHLMLLPSEGEAYGIAPCEAAQFGRPTLASDVGGLPTVVQDGYSGVLLAVDASAEEYARAIAELVLEPKRYEALSAGATERARSTLNWECWAQSMSAVLRRAAHPGMSSPAESTTLQV